MKTSLAHVSLSGLAMTLGITSAAVQAAAPKAPLNVLLFIADDMSWQSVAACGGPAAEITPNINRFASQGMIFLRAHVVSAICQPSRGALATGMYPHTSGVEGFYHTPGPVKTVMSELSRRGYRTGILGKCDHSTPDASFRWDMIHDGGDLGRGRNPQKYADYFREFVRDCKKRGQPFYFMANSQDPHRPFHDSDLDRQWRGQGGDYPLPSRVFSPDEIIVPGFLPDLPDVRRELAQYCSSARRCDDTFGAMMQVLEEEGLAENTLVVFLSDNGMSQPFAKTNAYFNSTRTPLIVRYPGVTKPGSKDDAHFVNGIDFMPTVLDACGFAPPEGVDGRTFLPLLRGEKQDGRERVFTQIYETSRRGRYPMFSVQDANYIMIYNPWSDGSYVFRNEAQGGLASKAMDKAAQTDARIRERVNFHRYRVPLELYNVKKDPDALANLAGDPKYAEVVNCMSAQLKDWMQKYEPTPAAAFNAFPSDKQRAVYMEAQLRQAQERQKNNKGKGVKAGDE